MKLKPAQENWYRVAICLHEFGQHLVAPRLQILEIFRVIGAEPHHHGKVADLGGGSMWALRKLHSDYMIEESKMAAMDPVHNVMLDVELILDVCISDARDS